MNLVKTILTVSFISMTVVSCSSNRDLDAASNNLDPDIQEIGIGGVVGGDVVGGDEVVGVNVSALGESSSLDGSEFGNANSNNSGLDSALPSDSIIYFDYDSSDITELGRAIILSQVQYLLNNDINILLEGHTDERGTREYNLALGEGRAEMVSGLLQAAGIASSRIQIVSYGEERPASLGSEEFAWSQNRRVEILYQ